MYFLFFFRKKDLLNFHFLFQLLRAPFDDKACERRKSCDVVRISSFISVSLFVLTAALHIWGDIELIKFGVFLFSNIKEMTSKMSYFTFMYSSPESPIVVSQLT